GFLHLDDLAATVGVFQAVLDHYVHDGHALHLGVVVDHHAFAFEVGGHEFGYVLILEGEDAGRAVHQVYPGAAEVGEDAGELAADDAGPDDHDAARLFGEPEDAIAGEDGAF